MATLVMILELLTQHTHIFWLRNCAIPVIFE